ncbi:TonB-dependent receptor plug domain-containing protein [Sulfurihydrogenibium subterraneum]|uniref:TonB-dependent receptor plug domain-containing protein n=1 Tax=Sulfurihydrogenibium subterraneum TaxID=171121 RepID=UPI00048D20F6|nr:TonB-dependent receptor [Sulfurihydrogenibium subterraneum]
MKNKKVLTTLLSLLLVKNVFAQEKITTLLNKYEEASDLSNRTKIESLGHYITITRKDLEIMQANTLSDVLKSLKLHSYIPNTFGVYQLTAAGSQVGLNTSYRLFIDDHEVSSIHTDNPFLIYDNYPLDSIDHIEIYLGAGAVRIGNEPSILIIKLYTKDPKRENSTTVKGLLDTRKGYSYNFTDARLIKENISYLVSVYKGYNNYKTYYYNNNPLNRDSQAVFGIFKLNYYDTQLTLNFAKVSRDAFKGLAVDISPDKAYTQSQDFYISLTQKLLEDKSLTLNISYDYNQRQGEFENKYSEGGVFVLPVYNPPLSIPYYYYEKRNLKKYTFYLSKEFKTDNNILLIGTSYKIKQNDVEKADYKAYTLSGYTSGSTKDLLQFNKTDLYTVFAENQYNINEKNLIFLSLKYDYYRRENLPDIKQFIARIGHTSFINENLYIKSFITKTYMPPSFYELEQSKNPKDLRVENLKGFSSEIVYEKGKNTLKLFYGYTYAKDLIIFTQNGTLNYEGTPFHLLDFEYTYKITPNNKIIFDVFKAFLPSSKFSPTFGGSIKTFNSFDRFDIYGELIYRNGFEVFDKKVNSTYNLNAGLIYNFDRNLSIKVKGENLLNSSYKTVLFGYPNQIGIFDAYDRKLVIGIEKVF